MGFLEQSPRQVHSNIEFDGTRVSSSVNGRTMTRGRLAPSLGDLRKRMREIAAGHVDSDLSLREVASNVQDINADLSSEGGILSGGLPV